MKINDISKYPDRMIDLIEESKSHMDIPRLAKNYTKNLLTRNNKIKKINTSEIDFIQKVDNALIQLNINTSMVALLIGLKINDKNIMTSAFNLSK